jgi:hypothetical protein
MRYKILGAGVLGLLGGCVHPSEVCNETREIPGVLMKSCNYDTNQDGKPEILQEISEKRKTIGDKVIVTRKISDRCFGDDVETTRFVTRQYDENNKIVAVKTRLDRDIDGMIDWISERTYDTKGQMLTGSDDFEGDGVIDLNVVRKYTNDIKIREEVYQEQSDKRTITFFDNKGKTIEILEDEQDDGSYEIRTTFEQIDGKLTESKQYFIGPNGLSLHYINKFNEKEQKVESHLDMNQDGIFENIERFEYNAHGDVIKTTYDTNGDGHPNKIMAALLDSKGDIIGEKEDANGDGIFEKVENWNSFNPEVVDTVKSAEPETKFVTVTDNCDRYQKIMEVNPSGTIKNVRYALNTERYIQPLAFELDL